MTPAETSLIQRSIESIYKTFTKRVADGRKLSIETVDSLAQGRIYSGKDAVKIGLVDEIGDVEDAIASAASMAKLKNIVWLNILETKPPFEKFMEKLSGKEKLTTMRLKLQLQGNLKPLLEYIEVKRLFQNNRIQARLLMTVLSIDNLKPCIAYEDRYHYSHFGPDEVLFENSIIKMPGQRRHLTINVIDLRNYSLGNYKQIDDYRYGGPGRNGY